MEQKTEIKSNLLYYGDNLVYLQDKQKFPDNSVDLIYVDSDFSKGKIQIYDEKTQNYKEKVWMGGIESYVRYMKKRLLEMYRILSNTGTIYIHCDHHVLAEIKILMDNIIKSDINKEGKYETMIVWQRESFASGERRNKIFAEVTDYILVYSKGKHIKNIQYLSHERDYENLDNDPCGGYIWYGYTKNRKVTPEGLLLNQKRIEECGVGFIKQKENGHWQYKRFKNDLYIGGKLIKKGMGIGDPIPNVWYDIITKKSIEKPEALLERIILTSSNTDSVVLDPFLGTGTTAIISRKFARRFIGIDHSSYFIHQSANRLGIPESEIFGLPIKSNSILDISSLIKNKETEIENIEEINDLNDTIKVLLEYKSPFNNIPKESLRHREEAAILSQRFKDVMAEEQINDKRPDITRKYSKIAVEVKNNQTYWVISEKIIKYLDNINYKYVIFSLHNMKGTEQDFINVKIQLKNLLNKEHFKKIFFINKEKLSNLND